MIVSLDLNKLSPNHSFAISSIYQLPVEGGRPITLPHCAQKQGPQTDLMIPDWKWHSLQHGTNLDSCMAGFWRSFEVQATSAYRALINSCQKTIQYRILQEIMEMENPTLQGLKMIKHSINPNTVC